MNPRSLRPFALAGGLLLALAPGVSAQQVLLTFGEFGSGNGQFHSPAGMAVDPAGNIFVCDAGNSRVQKFTSDGVYLSQFGSFGTDNGQFKNAFDIAIDSNGNLYVSDYQNHRIQKFDANGTFLAKWGSLGLGDLNLRFPAGIAVGPGDRVYVMDSGNNLVKWYSSTGTFLGKVAGGFNQASGVDVDQTTGEFYVSDYGNNRIVKFSSSAAFLFQWGSPGSDPGQFNPPTDVAVGPDGSVYVVDAANYRLVKFTSGGAFVTQWGEGSGLPFAGPFSVTADRFGNLYVSDTSNRVVKLGTPPTPTIRSSWGRVKSLYR